MRMIRRTFSYGTAVALTMTFAVGASSSGRPAVSGALPHDVSLAASANSWTVYHGNGAGTGVDTSGVTFSPAHGAWVSPALDGQLFGEPLEATGRVFVATENDTVYALAANTGAVLWSTHLAAPVPSSALPCGDISPDVGITGTPVIDESRGEIFAVADEYAGGHASHHLVGLDIYSGALMLDQAVDPAGQNPLAILQRTGLNLSAGDVVFGYGGNAGDCPTYHGWVLGVPESGGTPFTYEVDSASGESQGAVWMGGAAPEVDGSGNVWAAAGNGSVTSSSGPYDYSDSVFELSPQLARLQYFAPSNWYSDNAGDADLGSASPALLANGTVFQAGKSSTGYLLNQASLGGIGHQLTSAGVCSGNDVDGGTAVSGNDVFIPCRGGIEDIRTNNSPASISVAWQGKSAVGPPIVAGGLVWSIGGSTLYAYSPNPGTSTPQPVQSLSVGGEANHFPTPSVGDGLLLAPSTDQVYAFYGSAGIPGPPSSAPPPFEVGFQGNGGPLWSVGQAGSTDWNVGLAPNTSPSLERLGPGSFEFAFQANGGALWTVGNGGWTNWGVGMAPNTSPSIVRLSNGGYMIAFQGNGGGLWTVGTAGWTNWGVGMAPNTSPSVVALPNGGYEVAFQANGGALWSVGTAGWTDWGVGMAPGTSPSVFAPAGGGDEMAFQAYGGSLWSVGSAGWTNWNVGMAADTSPSAVRLSNGGYEIGFQANSGNLWTVGTPGWTNWNVGMAPGTSPSLTALSNAGIESAFQANGGALWTVGSAGWTNWSLGVAPSTSPSAA